MKPKTYLLLSSLLAGALLFTGFAWAKGKEATRVGKTVTISFAHETQVGNVTFNPGDYTVRHRTIGANQYMVFQHVTEPGPYYDMLGGVDGKPQRIVCRMEPLSTKVSDTTASLEPEGSVDKLTKIEIAGENVEHLF